MEIIFIVSISVLLILSICLVYKKGYNDGRLDEVDRYLDYYPPLTQKTKVLILEIENDKKQRA